MKAYRKQKQIDVPEEVHAKVIEALEQIREREESVAQSTISKEKHKLPKLPKAAALAAAFTLVIGATAFAAEHFQWNERLLRIFGSPSAELQEKMEDSGIVSALSAPATAGGITITPMHAVHDADYIYLLFEASSDKTVFDGFSSFSGIEISNADTALFSTQNPSLADERLSEGSPINGVSHAFFSSGKDRRKSSQFYIDFSFDSINHSYDFTDNSLIITLSNLVCCNENGAGSKTVKGPWTFSIPVTDIQGQALAYEPDDGLSIADVPLTVNKVEITPLSVVIYYDLQSFQPAIDKLYTINARLRNEIDLNGVAMKNGEIIDLNISYMGETQTDGEIIDTFRFNNFLDIDEVASLLFGTERTKLELQ